ncbi:MAG TPA: hypothetical protein V6C57_19670, partial [Coleofasciculaceae cyanobacterium]
MESSVTSDQLQHALPTVGEHGHNEEANSMFGFIVFLLSESVIFLGFFTGYITFKLTTADWLPAGV